MEFGLKHCHHELVLNKSFAVTLRKQETIQWYVSQGGNSRSYSDTSVFFLALQSCNIISAHEAIQTLAHTHTHKICKKFVSWLVLLNVFVWTMGYAGKGRALQHLVHFPSHFLLISSVFAQWLCRETIADVFPDLFSHCQQWICHDLLCVKKREILLNKTYSHPRDPISD